MNEIETVKGEEEVKIKALPVATEAMAIIVRDQDTLGKANQAYLMIDAIRKEIKDFFNPIVEAWKESKKKADEGRALTIRKWEKTEEPLVRARAYLDTQIVGYKRIQDKIREEEEEKNRQQALREEADRRKKEEEASLKQAAKLEKKGLTEEANALIEETIQKQEEPIQVYVVPPTTPKVELQGMSTVTTWHAEITDLRALCLAVGQGKCPTAYVEANMPTLNRQAVSLNKEMRIPGVRAVPETKARPTGRRAA